MSRRQALIGLIVATPGLHMQELAALLGLTTKVQKKSLSTQLSQLCKAKKLRKDSILAGSISRPRYWPTPTSTIDGRTTFWAERRERLLKQPKPVAPPKPKHETRAQKRARYASEKARVPKVKSQLRIVDPPRPRPAAGLRPAQTVEEFQRRGGHIEYLPQAVSSNPLRFDHSATDVPIDQRRPSIRHQPAPFR